jgi:class 3 adenylate cyclase
MVGPRVGEAGADSSALVRCVAQDSPNGGREGPCGQSGGRQRGFRHEGPLGYQLPRSGAWGWRRRAGRQSGKTLFESCPATFRYIGPPGLLVGVSAYHIADFSDKVASAGGMKPDNSGAASMQQIVDWLEKLGLGQYAQRFAENDISFVILPDLTDQDLEKIGVASLGHRRLLLRAIAELRSGEKDTPKAAVATASLAAPQDTAERRQVTVMFSDLVGSTALSARMDLEDLREIISGYQKAVAETVQRFGGFVAKYMGDGVLVYFGYPQAHEDDAERAVRAGLELIQAVGALKSGTPLQTRVGVATGLVVVGDLVGSGEAQERRIVGETPNLAARLQGVAEPNTVIIAESTRKLLGGLFELADLGAIQLKGILRPVQAWTALRTSSLESRFEALRTATTPLIGREEEIELLMRRWSQAKAGDGCVVLISGEPGIGKSRLAEAIQERLKGQPHTRLRYFCSPHHQDSALYPAISQLERAAGFRRDDTAEERINKLETLLARASNDVSEVASLIADLLSIPTGNRYPGSKLTPYKRKEKTLRALVSQVKGLSARETRADGLRGCALERSHYPRVARLVD